VEWRRLGPTGLRISRLGLGCGNFGGIGSAPAFFGMGESEAQAFELMDRVFDAGINFFDTRGGEVDDDLTLRGRCADDRGFLRRVRAIIRGVWGKLRYSGASSNETEPLTTATLTISAISRLCAARKML
jgi:aryl-alcohol dehydrogenase-like predicted oxidoreductase